MQKTIFTVYWLSILIFFGPTLLPLSAQQSQALIDYDNSSWTEYDYELINVTDCSKSIAGCPSTVPNYVVFPFTDQVRSAEPIAKPATPIYDNNSLTTQIEVTLKIPMTKVTRTTSMENTTGESKLDNSTLITTPEETMTLTTAEKNLNVTTTVENTIESPIESITANTSIPIEPTSIGLIWDKDGRRLRSPTTTTTTISTTTYRYEPAMFQTIIIRQETYYRTVKDGTVKVRKVWKRSTRVITKYKRWSVSTTTQTTKSTPRWHKWTKPHWWMKLSSWNTTTATYPPGYSRFFGI